MSKHSDGRPFNEPDAEPERCPISPEPAPTGPSARCPDCRGSGRIVLLTSSRACGRCGGEGRLGAAAARPSRTVEAPDGSIRTYDEHGRLIMLIYPCRGEVSVWQTCACAEASGRAWPENATRPEDGEPADPEPSPPALCDECGGTGTVTLPNGSMLCTRCRSSKVTAG